MNFRNRHSDLHPDFDRYPDREVLCMGVPYPGSKLVNGVWYFRAAGGGYCRFSFQHKVREIERK